MSLWDRFDTIATPSEVMEIKSSFDPIEAGKYTAVLEKLEASESKSGLPMLKGQFRTLDNKVVFYNQMLQNLSDPKMTAVNIAEAVKFISALKQVDIEFEGLASLALVVEGIPTGTTYDIQVKYGTKDVEQKFPKISIIGLTDSNTDVNDDDLPF
jgi:hypothetical protein